jgi:hypothetical protein
MFKITKSTVDETGGEAGGAPADIPLVQQQHGQPTHGSVASDAGAVDAGANYDQIKICIVHLLAIALLIKG